VHGPARRPHFSLAIISVTVQLWTWVFWVISVYFNIRNTLPKSDTFHLGHHVYVPELRRNLLTLSSFIYSLVFSPCAGTIAQSGDRYGSGTLHPGQVLRSRLPLLSPAFRSSHFRRQVPPRPQGQERSQQ